MTEPLRPRRLPLKLLYRGLELSAETEVLLERVMIRLQVDDPEEAVNAALRLFLHDDQSEEKVL